MKKEIFISIFSSAMIAAGSVLVAWALYDDAKIIKLEAKIMKLETKHDQDKVAQSQKFDSLQQEMKSVLRYLQITNPDDVKERICANCTQFICDTVNCQ